MRRIAVVITARPSFARVRTVLEALCGPFADRVDCRIIMAGSSLLHHYGAVEQDCAFPIAHRVYSTLDGHTLETSAQETGLLAIHLTRIFAEDKPDVVVSVADRHETLATALAVAYQHIPLAHIQGGERTGSIDDKVRDAVSMLADIHFPATALAGERLREMGVRGDIVVTGCPSVDLALRAPVDRESAQTIVVLQHPVTNEVSHAADDVEATYRAILPFADRYRVLWVWPGQDAGTESVAKRLREHRDRDHPGITFTRHLEATRFLSTVRGCACLVGNSSVGIRECGALGTPVVNIGTRQQNREHGANVLHAPHDSGAITHAIQRQLDYGRYQPCHLYGDGRSGARIAEALVRRAQGVGSGPGTARESGGAGQERAA